MTEPNQETSVRKLGSGSGVGGDGLVAEFDPIQAPVETTEYQKAPKEAYSKRPTVLVIEGRPTLLHFLNTIYDVMEDAELNQSVCEPCQLTLEVTFGDQTLRLSTELQRRN